MGPIAEGVENQTRWRVNYCKEEKKRRAHRVCGQGEEEEVMEEEVGILGGWTRKGGQERIGEGSGVCLGRFG